MMTCSATWNSVDDCIMKNSLEAGGTMEAIAAGIMPMSRSYTYKELEERWLLMLYDPDVSALASAGMLEVELSGACPTKQSIKSETYKGYHDSTAKRKRSNIRKQYYAMRKKSRVQHISSADLSLLDVPESFIPSDLGFEEDDLDILRSVFPETITDYEYPAECPMANGIIKNGFPHDFVDLSESLLNFAIEDEMDLMGKNELDAIDETLTDYPPASVHEEGKTKCEPTSGTSSEFHEPNCSFIWCTLNTEVLEVPSNDDIFLLIHDESSPSSPSSSGDVLGNLFVDCAVKCESMDPKVDNFSRPQVKVEGTMASLGELSICAEGDLVNERALQRAINGEASESEESQSDEDPPCTSDVENMILEMGFDPPGKENPIGMEHRISRSVRYLSEDTKRTIMRLEQCYQTVMRRRLSRQGAFAILYGRRLKHYIRKTKVVVGRSADDVDVDIDLSREGSAKRVSRQQAIIKLEANGFFSLKNIGRGDVSINGEKALVGQTRILSSGCLIEIASMGFVFEINEKYVRRYMDINA